MFFLCKIVNADSKSILITVINKQKMTENIIVYTVYILFYLIIYIIYCSVL